MAGIKDFILGFVGYTLVFVIVGIVLRLVFFKEFPLTETNEVLGSLFLACFIVLIGPVGATVAHAARKGRPFIATGILSAFLLPYLMLTLLVLLVPLLIVGSHNVPIFIYALLICITFVTIFFWFWMLIDCAKRNFNNDNKKATWLIIIFITGIIGAIIYYLFEKRKNIT